MAASFASAPLLQKNARANAATLLAPALSDYQIARSTMLSVMDTFDSAVAAGSDTTSIAGSFQLAQTNYQVAQSGALHALGAIAEVVSGHEYRFAKSLGHAGKNIVFTVTNVSNAVIGARYDTTELAQGVTEVLAYGTAVIVEPLNPGESYRS
jgi:hypothetical protein